MILANWPNEKHTICTINNNIPIQIQSHPYVLVNRSVLCNCRIEAENNFLLESSAACHDSNTKLVTYFTISIAFTNYIDQFNLLEELEALIKLLQDITCQSFSIKVHLMTHYYPHHWH